MHQSVWAGIKDRAVRGILQRVVVKRKGCQVSGRIFEEARASEAISGEGCRQGGRAGEWRS